MVWVNGIEQQSISVLDRGLLYGDGFFTTCTVKQGVPEYWSFHWQRLCHAGLALSISLPHEDELLAEIARCVTTQETCGMRLLFTRGVGGRGYTPPNSPSVMRILQQFEIPTDYARLRTRGLSLITSAHRLGTEMKALRGIKSLNRLEQVLIKQELAQHPEVDDLVLLNEDGHIVEASAGNLFWRVGKQWFTPSLTKAGISGVIRAFILSQRSDIQIVDATLDALEAADEALVTNSLLHVAPIRKLNDKSFKVVEPRALSTVNQW